ncbi:hypothetical protein ABT112_16630 [Streptomyces sp. NPDC002055]|uniref:hypothetical protein n=1 Tax=Streptomyces sp. NPDC002055 TaxID=3154534 RepID=UPI003316D017
MSTGAIIILAVAAAVIVALLLAKPVLQSGGSGLRRRFGPEYDRAVARHDGDTKAAHKELSERLRRHGDLRVQPLAETAREQYVARWAGIQEQFVDSPAAAVTEADRLLGRLVRDRGFPADAYDEQVDALSVHHAEQVGGYRRIHAAARRVTDGRTETAGRTETGSRKGSESRTETGSWTTGSESRTTETEELREALVGARALFEQLVTSHPRDHHGRNRPAGRFTARGRAAARNRAAADQDAADRAGSGKPNTGRLHLPWAMNQRGPGATKGGA